MNTSDTQVISPTWIAPVDENEPLLTGFSLVVQDNRITALEPTEKALAEHPDARHFELPGRLVTPGFVNCHGHAAMTLLRGVADDREMMDWLTNWIWPVEGELVTPEFVYDGSRLAALEMIMSGTTCAADTYFFPEETAKAFSNVGMRAQIAMPVLKFPNAWARDEEEHIHKGLAFRDSIKNSALLTTAFAPHSPYSVTDQGFERINLYAEQLDLPIHLHLQETASEVSDSIEEFGVRPVARLNQLGVISASLQAVHVTQLREDEISLFAERGVQVVHCPESNMKLASGTCPVDQLKKAGVNVALGTDGAASNNDLDMLQEMRSASFLSKSHTGDATSITAHEALKMMTLGGARFLGLEDEIGSLTPGKLADITAIDLRGPMFQPLYNPISQMIYTTTGRDVSHVWINGVLRMENRQPVDLDVEGILNETSNWRDKITQVLNKR